MGSHGAGLVDIIFADDPLVIELFPRGVLKPHFYFVAKMMGFEYVPIITDADESNLIVDMKPLRDTLNSLRL